MICNKTKRIQSIEYQRYIQTQPDFKHQLTSVDILR